MAASYGYERKSIRGINYTHVLYKNKARYPANRLHIYIEGDGKSWSSKFVISTDPTPLWPMMLRLMKLDRANAMYLGRPCYFGYADSEACTPDDWTYGRFSEKVVRSMVKVVRDQSRQFDSIVLFGHSGGGALALLIAEHLPKTEAVVTVAGNLDVDAWVEHHHYTRLYGSLNPADRPALNPSVRQLHLLGGRDTVVPQELSDEWLTRQQNTVVWRFNSYNHSCCWEREWSKVLRWIDQSVYKSASSKTPG